MGRTEKEVNDIVQTYLGFYNITTVMVGFLPIELITQNKFDYQEGKE